jgi:Skp family chaperone for outer membrane proteins
MTWLRAFLVWVLLAAPVAAQDADSPILIIDRERVFASTDYGRRLAAELAAQAEAVQAENERIVQTLTEEERSLTLRRPDMTAQEFRTEATAFDLKAQEVRRARDAKTVELQLATAEARTQFEERVQNIIGSILIERGASMIVEQRFVFLSVRSANITDDAIARIDAELGDGRE